MAVVSDQAVAAGIASIPGPFSEAFWDGWFVWRSFTWDYDFKDATGAQVTTIGSAVFEVDSKAMRKVSENETIVIVAESQSGAFGISTPLRVLLKLS